VKGRDKWRTYVRIVRGRSSVERGKKKGKKEESTVGIDGFSVQMEI